MQLSLKLCLPQDAISVPVARRIISQALHGAGYDASDIDDVTLALTEACSNVLRHAGGAEAYDVELTVDNAALTIAVLDRGKGFDASVLAASDDDAETGRGIYLMRALVDDVRFDYRPGAGALVQMVKQLRLEAGGGAERLTQQA